MCMLLPNIRSIKAIKQGTNIRQGTMVFCIQLSLIRNIEFPIQPTDTMLAYFAKCRLLFGASGNAKAACIFSGSLHLRICRQNLLFGSGVVIKNIIFVARKRLLPHKADKRV